MLQASDDSYEKFDSIRFVCSFVQLFGCCWTHLSFPSQFVLCVLVTINKAACMSKWVRWRILHRIWEGERKSEFAVTICDELLFMCNFQIELHCFYSGHCVSSCRINYQIFSIQFPLFSIINTLYPNLNSSRYLIETFYIKYQLHWYYNHHYCFSFDHKTIISEMSISLYQSIYINLRLIQ